MPFTLAHPAAVLPMIRKQNKWLFPTALVLGTMAPDFEYFIHLKPYSTIGHQLTGFFQINLPFCLLLYCLWEYFMRKPFIRLLPNVLSHRLTPLLQAKNRLNSLRQLIVFSYSALLGMFTHVFWDSFTHDGGYFVTRIAGLNSKWFNIPVYKYLQHGSTLLGFAAIALFVTCLKSQKTPSLFSFKQKVRFYAGTCLLSFILWLGFIQLFHLSAIGSLIIVWINACFMSTLILLSFFKSRYL